MCSPAPPSELLCPSLGELISRWKGKACKILLLAVHESHVTQCKDAKKQLLAFEITPAAAAHTSCPEMILGHNNSCNVPEVVCLTTGSVPWPR